MFSQQSPPNPDSPPSPTNDFDSPWKQALETYFDEFIDFFFPSIHTDIDWERGYEFLDTYLQQIVRDAETGKQFADKLVKVWRQSGEETCVFVHIEIQSQRETQFPKRMFSYYYRLIDRFDSPIVSLAVLADLEPTWRPNTFSKDLWGCSIDFAFPTVKLLDYRQQWDGLDSATNPFATVVMAHLKTQDTQGDPQLRRTTKLTMARALLQKGFDRQTVIDLLRFIDWLLALPPELEQGFWQDLIAFQEENRMPYLLSLERMALDRGREEGLEAGREEGLEVGREEGLEVGLEAGRDRQASLVLKLLQRKLGHVPEAVAAVIRSLNFVQLEAVGDVVWDLESWPQLLEGLVVNGIEPGVQQAVLLTLLAARWGELDEVTRNQALKLSVSQVRDLLPLVLGWESVDAFVAWLDQ
jgi:hypothetical protein